MRIRAGATLVEVLVASFVMAIGLISLLALFPLGAIEMAQAIKDDRVAACVANATAVATATNIRHDTFLPATDAIAPAFDNPGGTTNSTALPDSLGYPVYVDPVGFTSYLQPYKYWLGGQNGSISRRNVSFVENANVVPPPQLRWFTFLDDIDFNPNGTPSTANGSVVRENLYSWAYLLRRPRNANTSVVEMWVVVYYRRNLASLGGGAETIYTALIPSGFPANAVRLSTLPGMPAPQPGQWILDCTRGKPDPANGKLSPGNARFYRVVGVTQNGSITDVETDTPLQTTPAFPTQFALLEGAVEVVYRGTNWLP